VLVTSLIISFISLLVAGAALYFSHLRKAKIDAILGPDFDVYHHDYETGTSTGFVIPISFVNDSLPICSRICWKVIDAHPINSRTAFVRFYTLVG